MAKTIFWIQYQKKRIEVEKDEAKDGKTLSKLMNNALHGKTIRNLKNRVNVRLVINKNDFFKKRHQNPAIGHKKYLSMIWSWYAKVKSH